MVRFFLYEILLNCHFFCQILSQVLTIFMLLSIIFNTFIFFHRRLIPMDSFVFISSFKFGLSLLMVARD